MLLMNVQPVSVNMLLMALHSTTVDGSVASECAIRQRGAALVAVDPAADAVAAVLYEIVQLYDRGAAGGAEADPTAVRWRRCPRSMQSVSVGLLVEEQRIPPPSSLAVLLRSRCLSAWGNAVGVARDSAAACSRIGSDGAPGECRTAASGAVDSATILRGSIVVKDALIENGCPGEARPRRRSRRRSWPQCCC